jgi:hypothetical protein
MDGQDRTRELARRYLKGLIRVHICKTKLRETDEADVWGHMTWLASSFEQEAREAWYDYVQGKSLEALKPSIIQALTEAVDEASIPYIDILDKDWLDAQVTAFLVDFNPALLMPVKGSA